MIISLFLLLNILVPLGVSFLLFRKKKWYVHFVSFSLATLLCWYGVIASGISDSLGAFYYKGEVYDLETLTIMYYLIGIVPLVIMISIGIIIILIKAIREQRNRHTQ